MHKQTGEILNRQYSMCLCVSLILLSLIILRTTNSLNVICLLLRIQNTASMVPRTVSMHCTKGSLLCKRFL